MPYIERDPSSASTVLEQDAGSFQAAIEHENLERDTDREYDRAVAGVALGRTGIRRATHLDAGRSGRPPASPLFYRPQIAS